VRAGDFEHDCGIGGEVEKEVKKMDEVREEERVGLKRSEDGLLARCCVGRGRM